MNILGNGVKLPRLRLDLAMLAAAIVEVPRWAVAFTAIHEPVYAAVPMGLLLAWAASEGWKTYFDNRRRVLLLTINVASLVGALIVIAPVLYAMTSTPLDRIDLSEVLPPTWLAVWACVLAVTTFVPLIQVAAVKAYRAPKAQVQTQSTTTEDTTNEHNGQNETLATQSASTVDEMAHTETTPDATPSTTPERKRRKATPVVRKAKRGAKPTPEQRRAQILSAGLNDAAQVVAQFGVSLRTAQMDLNAIKTMNRTNGVHV